MYLLAGLVLIIVIVVAYLSLSGSSSSKSTSTVAGATTTGLTNLSAASTVPFNASEYTTVPPVANSTTGGQPASFIFLDSNFLNSTLKGHYVQGQPYSDTYADGVLFGYTTGYVYPNSSEVGITITQYNSTEYAYSLYNQSFNGLYAWAKEYNRSYYASTYLNASYFIANNSADYRGTKVTFYQAMALYSEYITIINITQINTTFTTQRLNELVNAEIANMSGYG